MLKEFLSIGRQDYANKSFNWISSDTEENYYQVLKNKDIPYGTSDIIYSYNNYGFRCDNFDHYSIIPYRILFAGCSMTEGIGLPLEATWAKLFHNMVCNELGIVIPYWNIATAGAGLDHLVRYVYNLKDFIRPQIIISYLPNNARRERWLDDSWSVWDLDETTLWKWPIKIEQSKETFLNERFIEYQTEKNLALLDMMLSEINCTFLYSSSTENFSISDYFNSTRYIQKHHIPEQYDFARDGIHAGPKTNLIMAERAFNFFWPYIEQRLTNPK